MEVVADCEGHGRVKGDSEILQKPHLCILSLQIFAHFASTRKTKLRAADIPSSFTLITGIPASSTSAPPPALVDLSAQSSQTSDAKFQSLFEGQVLIIQSLQELVQQRPIMSVEQFVEKVAWPRA
ncbi:hypothetical protein JHK87_027615 [Glycine soja]|nr:hypothetical protein JHK87_027615 [Glycine soja]